MLPYMMYVIVSFDNLHNTEPSFSYYNKVTISNGEQCRFKTLQHGRRNRGGEGQPPPPNILPTQKIQDCKNNDI